MRRVFNAFGIEDISSGQVSNMNKELDHEVTRFCTQSLNSHYPVIWIDALYEKIREDHKVVSKDIMNLMGIN